MSIEKEIKQIILRQGYITVDHYMHIALNKSDKSYYQSKQEIGDLGDFVTAPEISQLFGEMIGLWLTKAWSDLGMPKSFVLLELGGGLGSLMANILKVTKLVPELYSSIKIEILEINDHFRLKQQEKLKEAVSLGLRLKHRLDLNDLPQKPLIVIANEFFDAMPIKQYIKKQSIWHEIAISLDSSEKFCYLERPVGSLLQKILTSNYTSASEGAIVEVSNHSINIINLLSEHIANYGGQLLIIDYGYYLPPNERTKEQYNSTLQAIKNHKYCSIFNEIGSSDISAHVDFYALSKAALSHGLSKTYNTTQASFLLEQGINLRAHLLCQKLQKDEAVILQKQMHRLLSREEMGELFKVFSFGKIAK